MCEYDVCQFWWSQIAHALSKCCSRRLHFVGKRAALASDCLLVALTNCDEPWQEIKNYTEIWGIVGKCRDRPWYGQRLCPQNCWNLPEINRKKNSRKCMQESWPTQNNTIGRSESFRTQVRTQVHANNAYSGVGIGSFRFSWSVIHHSHNVSCGKTWLWWSRARFHGISRKTGFLVGQGIFFLIIYQGYNDYPI